MPDSLPTENDTFLLNGRTEQYLGQQSIADLLAKHDAAGPGVAVELNQQVVRHADHAKTRIEIGDQIEIVRLVGGG
ncbi:MAG: thiamine biosynthesis protein ThiS [Myxococcota bacterium]